MPARKCLILFLLIGFALTAQSPRGTVPRSYANAYDAHASQGGMKMGASLLTHKELKKVFATDVNQCCVVVEVAFYPPKDNFVKISLDDFMLREAGKELGTRPSTADVLAARLEVRPTPRDREHTPGLNRSSEVGYERTRIDNGNGEQQRSGIYQRQSVGVGIPVGGKRDTPEAAAPDGNRSAIEAELKEKSLAETSAWEPVAGYLYFSVPKKSKAGYELVYMQDDKKIVLPLK